MASYGRSPVVRSHRRGGRRRRVAIGPWLVIGLVIVLLGGGVTAGYAYFVKGGCSGRITATVVVTPRIGSIMETLAQRWSETSPAVHNVCASVTIARKDQSEVVTALSGEWDTKSQGERPDVWVPDSSAWARKASVDADAERMMPDLQPSLARTPTVIAMPKPLAEAAQMTSGKLTWRQVIEKLSTKGGWGDYGHDEWGPFKVGLSDPQTSTAGLLALMALSDSDDNGEVSQQEQADLIGLKHAITITAKTTEEIFAGLRAAAEQGEREALTYVSAFPALEQDVLTYNLGNPRVPLVAIYPQDGLAEADFPYLVLNAPWSDDNRKAVAAEFLKYVRGPEGKAVFLERGFRDSNRVPGPPLTRANGVVEKITALPRAVLLPEAVQYATASWTAITRPTNLLLVFDTSGSMAGAVRGTGQTRLDLTKAAAIGALDLLDDSARVGVWEFSTAFGSRDYRKLLRIARLDATTNGVSHREAVRDTIEELQAGGNTGLYNTAWAACQELTQNYQAGAANIIVILTDGADDNNVEGLTLPELLSNLRRTCGGDAKPVKLITVGLGIDADSSVLRQISEATGATSYSSPRSYDISQVLISALFS